MDIPSNIPRYGLPKKCQEIIPQIFNDYKNGKSLEESKRKFSKKNKVYAEEIYKRIELTIKELSLSKITPEMGLHREDVKYGLGFIDTILRYCLQYKAPGKKLEKKLMDSIKTRDRKRNKEIHELLKKLYKEDGRPNREDIKLIKSINNQKFHLFIAENLLNEKN